MKKTPKVCYTTLVSKLEAMDSEIMKLKKHIEQLEKENEEHIETLVKLKSIMK